MGKVSPRPLGTCSFFPPKTLGGETGIPFLDPFGTWKKIASETPEKTWKLLRMFNGKAGKSERSC